jgi:MerC mercury resistance protein
MNQPQASSVSDKAGITSAILCTVHCLIVPALFLAKFWLSDNAVIQLPAWWELLDFLFLAVSFFAVYHSASHTPVHNIKISLWVFWAILALSILFATRLHWLAYLASAGLIVTHFLNIRRMRRANYTK